MTPSLPAWVEKRDGRREAFDADKISQSIFAATEAVGEPNAFLARELADGVLHFLEQENAAEIIPTDQIVELVEKVVRELGQPALAHALAQARARPAAALQEVKQDASRRTFTYSLDDDFDKVLDGIAAAYALQSVFTRDLIAAHESGILRLWNLMSPVLRTMVLEPPDRQPTKASWKTAWTQVKELSRRAETLAVDSAERYVAIHGPEWMDGLVAAAEAYAHVVVNLNVPTPPAWADQLAAGPLFREASATDATDAASAGSTAAILDRIAADEAHACSVHWHLDSRDFEDSQRRAPLEPLLTRADRLGWISFVLHRRRQPVLLAHGLTRDHPAVSMRVGLSLMEFLDHPGIDHDGSKLLAKLPSLARMAVSAGVQNRHRLRRLNPDLSRGFLLDRARLVIETLDLQELVEVTTGVDPLISKPALDAGLRIVQTLRDAAHEAGRKAGLEVAVADVEGVVIDECLVQPKDMAAAWQAAGSLLDGMDSGMVSVQLATNSSDVIWRHLQHAWKTTGVALVHFRGTLASGAA
ncbi:MAG: hypothetical protein L0Y71_00645 [Gemmataceae bacterium]|nr:hypothetical protein [Gemmataceae bacterium]